MLILSRPYPLWARSVRIACGKADCKRSTPEISPKNFARLRKVTSGSHGNHPVTYAELKGVAKPACYCQRLLTYARFISRVDAIMLKTLQLEAQKCQILELECQSTEKRLGEILQSLEDNICDLVCSPYCSNKMRVTEFVDRYEECRNYYEGVIQQEKKLDVIASCTSLGMSLSGIVANILTTNEAIKNYFTTVPCHSSCFGPASHIYNQCNMLLTYLGQADPMLHRYLYLFKVTQLFEFLDQVVKDFIKNQPPNIPPVKQKPEDDGPEVSTDSGVFVFSMLAQLLTGEILGLEREECTEPIVNEIPVIIPVPSLNNPLPLTIQQMLLLTPLDQYSNNFTSSNNKPSTESNENISMSNTAKSELEAFYSGNRHQPVMNYAPLNNQVLMYQPSRCALENQEISSLYAVGQEEIMDMCISSMRNGIVSPLVQRIASSKNIYKYSSAKKRGRKLAKKLNFIHTASPKYNI
ncbi:unnamed protein product [Timema podura]|uniref:Uncharacterized protein n=1 Tax=Timema podura TaxID=61482 RepID=A0ABN7NZN2_TIMPD|nr:unnamed protein product [Timema podura]